MTRDARFEQFLRSHECSPKVTDAATVIVARDTDDGPAALMMRRSSKTAFGGMWVFPGGKVDESDREPDAHDDPIDAGRRAAVREAKEEGDLDLDVDALVAFSHWSPPVEAPRRFLTWFFVAAAPAGTAGDVNIDEGEITDHEWLTPRTALDRHAAGAIELAPPTFMTLHDLASHTTVDELLARARSRDPVHYVTRLTMTDAGPVVMWAGDAGYEASDPSEPGARHRIEITETGWVLMRDPDPVAR